MTSNKNLYEILNVPKDASIDEIKTRFHKLALMHHPDKNNNSPESQVHFQILYNAYTTLISHEKREEYDLFLKTIKTDLANSASDISHDELNHTWSLENLCGQFNYILWEIEDILNSLQKINTFNVSNKHIIHQWLSKILIFMDKWVLEPSGFIDYFYKARNIETIKTSDMITENFNKNTHQPYIDIYDYFYQIRKRTDKFITNITIHDVLEPITGCPIKILDGIFESQKLSYHYLGHIRRIKENNQVQISKFIHSDKCFEKDYLSLLVNNN